MSRRMALAAIALAALGAGSAPARAQARPPLSVADDSTGVLSAIRAIDYRQVCRCPTVMLDSTVRQDSRVSMFRILARRPWRVISEDDADRLRLARHRVSRTNLTVMTQKGPDSVFVATQLVAANDSARRLLVVATPPSGTTEAFLVTLLIRRERWRVVGVRSTYDP